jgi:hypothetical protein
MKLADCRRRSHRIVPARVDRNHSARHRARDARATHDAQAERRRLHAMTAECNRIWAREGITLTWDGSRDDADVVLPLSSTIAKCAGTTGRPKTPLA